jgi:hypothetical protein
MIISAPLDRLGTMRSEAASRHGPVISWLQAPT